MKTKKLTEKEIYLKRINIPCDGNLNCTKIDCKDCTFFTSPKHNINNEKNRLYRNTLHRNSTKRKYRSN